MIEDENKSILTSENKNGDWFSVEGDIDDFIFYGEEIVAESER